MNVQEESDDIDCFRNIATCDPSQNLYDDIIDEEDYEILQYIDNISSGIDHSKPKSGRFIQYGNIHNSLLCFDEKFWSWGRFGNRHFGVWYGALEEETSIKEALFHRPEIDKNDKINANSPIIQARRLFKASLKPNRFSDLRPYVNEYPLLISKKNYSFCQKLGSYAIKKKIDLYFTQSVRNKNGTCAPVFNEKIISDKPIKTYLNIFPLNGDAPSIAPIQHLDEF